MTKNTIYNIVIGLFLCSGLYNLSACIFNGGGITDGNPTTSSITSEQSDSLAQTSNIEPTTSYSSTSTCDLPITSIGITEVSGISIGSTTISVDSTTDNSTTISSTTEDLTTGEPICGDCIVNDSEECDPCSFISTPGYNYCIENPNDSFGQCNIMMNVSYVYAQNPLFGMQTPEFDQEESDLYCKIYSRTEDRKSLGFQIINTISYPTGAIFPFKPNDKAHLLKSATPFYNHPLYHLNNEDIPENLKEGPFLYTVQCENII